MNKVVFPGLGMTEGVRQPEGEPCGAGEGVCTVVMDLGCCWVTRKSAVEHQAACLTQGFSEYLFLSPFLPSPFGSDLGPGKLAGVSSTMIFTVCPLYPQLAHPWSQPTSDWTYLGKKLQKVSKSKA